MNEEKRKTEAEGRLLDYMGRRNLRRTPERMMILGKIVEIKGSFSSASLMQAIEEAGFHLSLATVYNSLRLFEAASIVRRRLSADGSELYEFDNGDDSHVTLVCSKCGRAREVRDPEIGRVIRAKRFSSFVASGFDLYVNGLCSRCRGGGRKRKSD